MSASFSPSTDDLRALAEFIEGLQQVTDRTSCYIGEHVRFAVTLPNGDSVQITTAPNDADALDRHPPKYTVDDRIGD